MTNRITDDELDAVLSNSTPAWVRKSSTASATDSAAANNSSASTAPAKAPAAPGKTKDVFTGLCEALNAFQRRLADPQNPNRTYDIADEYQIEFAPVEIGASTLKRQGTLDKTKTPLQQKDPASLKPSTTSVNNNGRVVSVTAGMQIVQFIDQMMRNSSYITDQQTYIVDSKKTDKPIPNPNPPGSVTAWYKISVEATQLGFDNRRKDFAYRMKFVIAPYAINTLPSDWFRNSRYRGSHKRYNYWFTGANAEILNFEQEYNFLYRLVISGQAIPVQQRARTDFRDVYTKTFLPTSENHAKGADGYQNEPGDNAASFLYSPSDQTVVKLRIVGDPAWLQQGEVSSGINARNFNFNPFASDGTINYDSQEIVFDISWNQPADYDLNTGLMDLNRTEIKSDGTYSTQPQYNFTYTAINCKSYFSKGKFEQEIEGRLLTEFEKNAQTTKDAKASGRAPVQNPQVPNSARSSTVAEDTNSPWVDVNGLQVSRTDVTPDGDANQNDSAPQLLNSPDPAPPTSDASIVTPGDEDAQQVAFTPPPRPATAEQLAAAYNGTAPTDQELEARNAYISAGSPSSGPLRDAYINAQSSFNSRVSASSSTPSVQTPQKTVRET